MAIPFKRVARWNPRMGDEIKYHPLIVTQGQSVDLDYIAYQMRRHSSLSLGDIKSVLTNFVEEMCIALLDGKSVNIQDFGVFSMSARTKGALSRAECTIKNIETLRINFRASSSVKPNLTSTRAGEKIEFLDLDAQEKKDTENGGGSTCEKCGSVSGGGSQGGNGSQDSNGNQGGSESQSGNGNQAGKDSQAGKESQGSKDETPYPMG